MAELSPGDLGPFFLLEFVRLGPGELDVEAWAADLAEIEEALAVLEVPEEARPGQLTSRYRPVDISDRRYRMLA